MSAEDDIYRAVHSAVNAGLSAQEYMQKSWEQWEVVMSEKSHQDGAAFRLAVRGKNG